MQHAKMLKELVQSVIILLEGDMVYVTLHSAVKYGMVKVF